MRHWRAAEDFERKLARVVGSRRSAAALRTTGGSEFCPFSWQLKLSDHSLESLETSIESQAVLLHEYVHFLQLLTGTLGRQILIETTRLIILAALERVHGDDIPSGFSQVSARAAFHEATLGNFQTTEAGAQYTQFAHELAVALNANECSVPDTSDRPLLTLRRQLAGLTLDQLHVVVPGNGGLVGIPSVDTLFCENMARAMQLQYLVANNGSIVAVSDELNKPHGDRLYRAIETVLSGVLPFTDDSKEWTVAVCQLTLLARRPGHAFRRVIEALGNRQQEGLETLLGRVRSTLTAEGEWDDPPVQDAVDELCQSWATCLVEDEQRAVHALATSICTATNAMALGRPLVNVQGGLEAILGAMRMYGCPKIFVADREDPLEEFCGVRLGVPWLDMMTKAYELMWVMGFSPTWPG